MMTNHLLLCCLVLLVNSCSKLYNNTMFLTGTYQEVINIPLSQLFLNQNYEKLSFKESNKHLIIAAPIQQYAEANFGDEADSKTIAQKLFKSTKSRDPIQHMTALVYQGSYLIYQNVGLYQTLPIIKHVSECGEKYNSICYDIVELKTLTIIECEDSENSYFSVVKNEKIVYLDIESPISEFRKIDQIDSYLIRGTANKIELYSEEQDSIKHLKTLDEQAFITLLQQDNFKLSIIDFQTHTNGQVSIMNEFGEIIIIEYKNDNWELIKTINTEIEEVKGYDYDAYTQTYVVLSYQSIKYKQKDKDAKTRELLNFAASNKVYLTKKNILLLQKQTITLYSQELVKVYELSLKDQKSLITTNPFADGFITISDTKGYGYAINNEYFIQATFNETLQQNYLKAILKQEDYPEDCEITIFYKTENFNQNNILMSQSPDGLIDSGVYEDFVKVKLNPVFQGSNIQYNFEPNDIITITVEKHQNALLKNITETNNIIYRKIVSKKFQPKLYLIQQDTELKMIGYSCTNFAPLQLNCHILFINPYFTQLSNSQNQQWWYNDDSLFFAIFKDQQITVYYYCYKDRNFVLLTQINLESNVKQIAIDGYNLYVLTQQFVKIYSITTTQKDELFFTLEVQANKLFASSAQYNYFFLEVAETLYIYTISYDKETLVWFTQIESDYEESNLAIFQNYFVRFTKTKNNDEYTIKVFNYANKNNIYVQKRIDINNYSAINLNNLEYSVINNLFYILGKNTKTQRHYVLVYQIKSNSLDSLYNAIQTSSSVQFSVTGEYLFLTDSGTNSLKLQNIYIKGILVSKAKLNEQYKQLEYSKQIMLNLEITNDSQNKLATKIPLNIVNRGVKIFQVKESLNFTQQLQKDQKKYCVDLGQSWYSGQALEMELVQQSENAEFNSVLTKQKETLEFSPFIKEFNNNTLVQLMDNKITLVNKADLSVTDFQLDEKYLFKTLLFIDQHNIYVEASKDDSIELRIIQCKDQTCVLLENSLQFNSTIQNVFLHRNNFFFYVGDTIQVYDTKGDSTQLESFEKIQEFNQSLELIQIEFRHIKGDIYQFISLDYEGNPEFQMREISRQSTQSYNKRFLIKPIIAQQKINVDYYLTSAGFVLNEQEMIIILQSSASYQFHFDMDCSRNELCEITKFELNGVFQQYSNWGLMQQYPIIYLNENFLQIIYFAYTNNVLLIYDIQTQSSNSKPNNAIVGIQSPIEIAQPDQLPIYQVMSIVYSYNGKLHLLASAEDKTKLQHYIIQRSTTLCTDITKFEDTIKLKLSNPDNQIYVDEKIKIFEQSPPSPDEKKSFPIWAIFLIIIGIFISILCGLLLYRRRQRNKLSDRQELQFDSDQFIQLR